MFAVQLVLLLVIISSSVYGQQGLPFQVNTRKTCETKISLDSTTLTGVRRGDEDAPCSGYLMYTDEGKTRQMCGDLDYGISDYSAERACYTLGVNFYRNSNVFDSSRTRQMKLFKCFNYKEQGVDSVDTENNMEVFQAEELFDDWTETVCTDAEANPAAYDCFDTCYFSGNGAPVLATETACADGEPFFTIGCADINECENGVQDYCTGPYESSCTIRTACGNNTDCTNHPGSFQCSCKNGYEYRSGDSFDPYDLKEGCKDIDECKQYTCDINARCVNTLGSYICWCNDGFMGDGKTCTPADNCYVQGFCKNGQCQLINGVLECVCQVGYSGLRCDTPTTSIALILSIVALVLFGLLVIILLVVLCMWCIPQPEARPAHRSKTVVRPVIVSGTSYSSGFSQPPLSMAPTAVW